MIITIKCLHHLSVNYERAKQENSYYLDSADRDTHLNSVGDIGVRVHRKYHLRASFRLRIRNNDLQSDVIKHRVTR